MIISGRPMRLVRRLALVGAVAVVMAACSNGPSSSAGSAGSPTMAGGSMTLSTTSISGLGEVLAGPNGKTLYLLSADKNGTPTCTSDPCTAVWPPLVLSSGSMSPSAGSGVNASLLGTVKTPDGETQVTYNNWPVYTYSSDSGPGQAMGEKIQSFGGTWYAMSATGKPAGAGSGGGGGGGYGYSR